jgi:hypothetical protein
VLECGQWTRTCPAVDVLASISLTMCRRTYCLGYSPAVIPCRQLEELVAVYPTAKLWQMQVRLLVC